MNAIDIIIHGWWILTILLTASIASITVICERLITLRRAKLDTTRFINSVIDLYRNQGEAHAVSYCDRFTQPLAVVIRRALVSQGTVEMRERAYRHTLRAEIMRLRQYVPFLGTVGSITPFIGLFGTVVGIINAFGSIAENAGGGPEVVAGGIAEALVSTAAGLVVAIPAIIGFNHFQTKIKRLAEDIDLAAHEVLDVKMHEEGRLP